MQQNKPIINTSANETFIKWSKIFSPAQLIILMTRF